MPQKRVYACGLQMLPHLPCASYISFMQEYLSQWKVKEPSVREFIGSGGSIAIGIVAFIFGRGLVLLVCVLMCRIAKNVMKKLHLISDLAK